MGRGPEIAAVLERLRTARVVTLTGPGGCGKTRLALRVAALAKAGFGGGARLVELAPLTDPALVPAIVGQALGVSERDMLTPAAGLVRALADRELLVVLDNCEHVLEAAAGLVAKLLAQCPRVRFLATSRERLDVPGELVFPVPPLGLPADGLAAAVAASEAGMLFAARAAAASPAFELSAHNSAAVAQVCAGLDGIPLAIELAAARCSALGPAELAARLDGHPGLLSGGPARPGRHRSLEVLVAWSYELRRRRTAPARPPVSVARRVRPRHGRTGGGRRAAADPGIQARVLLGAAFGAGQLAPVPGHDTLGVAERGSGDRLAAPAERGACLGDGAAGTSAAVVRNWPASVYRPVAIHQSDDLAPGVTHLRQTVRGPRVRSRSWRTRLAKCPPPAVPYALLSALCPGAYTGDPIHRDVGDISGRWAVHGRKADIGTKIAAGESLEKFGSASLGDAGGAVDDQVLVQADGVALVGFDGQRHPAVVADIAHLAVLRKVARHDLIPVQAHPYETHLGTAVRVQGHKVRQGRGLQHGRALSGSDVMTRR